MASTTALIPKGSKAHCSVCYNLNFKSASGGDGYVYSEGSLMLRRSLTAFDKSSGQGCSVCWVLNHVCHLCRYSIDSEIYVTVVLRHNGEDVGFICDHNNLNVYVPDGKFPYHAITTSIYDLSRKHADVCLGPLNIGTPAFRHIPVKADISESAWSEVAQRFARHHIQACIQNHALCRLEKTLLPTRVIDVGTVEDSRLRLFETQGSMFGQYTALSYCWGGNQPLKTTSANIKDKTDGLLFSELPLTIADAVLVTRSLGVQYLWVDALCIIQDSVEDWERESEQMATIYEKAHLVIAASSSSAATKGFLSHQREQFQHHFTIPESYGTPGTIAVHKNPMSGLHGGLIRTDPLAQRAWAFQEQHMSTRCLIFSADEMQWVCRRGLACECGETIDFMDFVSHKFSLQAYFNEKPQSDTASTQLTLQARRAWRKAVIDYSSRNLTHADDKLPAISGIASRFAARSGLPYIAGLWSENIILDLVWFRNPQLHPVPLPHDYVAPSFSWASINTMVSYRFDTSHQARDLDWVPCSTICDIESVVLGSNPFGKVSDTWITLQAPMIQGSLKPEDPFISFRSNDGSVFEHLLLDSVVAEFTYATEDNELETSVQRYKLPQHPEEHERDRPDESVEPYYPVEFGRASERTKPSLWKAAVWLLHLARRNSAQKEKRWISDFYLVLGKARRDPRKYERIGSCFSDTTQPLDEPFDEQNRSFTTQKITIL